MESCRYADVSDLKDINTLIRDSKSYWGYSDSFLDAFMDGWGVDETYLTKNRIMLLNSNSQLLGLYSFKINDDNKLELNLFFVAREWIGRGVGRLMWQKAINDAAVLGWNEFHLIADPNAEVFYKHMGARTLTAFESFPGRFVPVMEIQLTGI